MRGYSLVLMVSEEKLENEQRAATSLLHWSVDGAIVVPVQTELEHWTRLRAAGVPLVLVNRDLPHLACDFVGIDFAGSAYRATCHVLGSGARQWCCWKKTFRCPRSKIALPDSALQCASTTVSRRPSCACRPGAAW